MENIFRSLNSSTRKCWRIAKHCFHLKTKVRKDLIFVNIFDCLNILIYVFIRFLNILINDTGDETTSQVHDEFEGDI